MGLGVYCECGHCLPVTENDAESAISCSCGRRVVVPLLEEFSERPILLSAATVERRAQRLVAKGELPRTDSCLQCGAAAPQAVTIDLQCERYTASASGGQRFLILPFVWGVIWTTWQEEERVEIRGRDTDVSTPVALCAKCRNLLQGPRGSLYILLAASVLAVGGVLGYFYVAWGLGTAVVGLAIVVLLRRFAWRSWQRALKALLQKVPVYRQILQTYPMAVVIVRSGRRTR